MKKSILYLLFFLPVCIFAQKQVYEAPNFKAALNEHKTVAILPLRVTISFKKMPKNYDAASNNLQEKEDGINLQQGMYTYLLRKADKYSVTFQDVQRTNVLLKQAGLFDKTDSVTADSLCHVLKVDAVITASYAYEKTGSEAGAIIKTVLF